ncbi:MAG: PSD1 and planctomycete cytochrome C domain-containing protein [Flavobacteriaceae bacterium]
MKRSIGSGILAILALSAMVLAYFVLKPKEKVDFSSQIKPILNDNCISCHGGVKKNGGFSLLFEKEALADTKSGEPAIIPGDASGSELIRRIKERDPELRMPYEKSPLSKEEIDLLTRWVNQGAAWGKHWAYTLPSKVEVPMVSEEAGFSSSSYSTFLKNDIDHFILKKLIDADLNPNLAAEKEIIARRVALDITGLPPDKNLFDLWMQDAISYEAMIDSLLTKETYGEKWASWWLDLARYADTKGYEKDQGRTLWEYRDWVIRAFNKDMPYDQFTLEQLAGDMLQNPRKDQLIATAFHRNTMNNDEGGTDDEEFRVATVIDRVNTTFSVWQSTTMECVQCHSHPYDPFKHKDYYNLFAFFNNSRDEDTPGEEPNLRFYDPEQQMVVDRINEWNRKYGSAQTVKKYQNFLTYMEPKYQAHLCEDFTNGELADTKWLALWDNGSTYLKNVWTQGATSMYIYYWSHVNGTKITVRNGNAKGEILTQFRVNKTKGRQIAKVPFKKVDEKIDLYIEAQNDRLGPQATTSFFVWFAFLEDLPGQNQKGKEEVEADFLRILNAKTPELPIMVENPEYMKRTSQLFERGNWLLKADTVNPKTPEALNPWNDQWPENRYGLAKWIIDEQNPLTARTLVNRIWHQLFGQGIVTSLEDMGTQSDTPSHPELLDWLALKFMHEHNWSIKALVKDIVVSGTYRQNSEIDPTLYQVDPENKLYARGPRIRLSAEQIRDQALFVSDLLSKKMYGPGVMPPQPEGIWQTIYNNRKWEESKGEDRYRRAVYTYLKRTSPYPSFLTFDAGSREVCTIRRTVTNTPLQALVTLNDPVYLEAAYQLAKHSGNTEDIDKGITDIYEKATYSKISPTTLKTLKGLYTKSLEEFSNNPEALSLFLSQERDPNPALGALTIVANAVMNLDEFLTKT